LALRFSDLDLDALAPRRESPDADGPPRGSVTGHIEVSGQASSRWEIAIDVALRDLEAVLPGLGPPADASVSLPTAAFRAALQITPDAVKIRGGRLEVLDAALGFSGRVERPIRRESVARVAAQLDPIQLSEVRQLLDALPAAARLDASATQSLEAGWLDDFAIEGRAPLERWPTLVVAGGEDARDWVEARAVFSGVVLRVADAEPFEELGGEILWNAERLELRDLHALRRGRPLPRLRIRLVGVQHLLAGDPASQVVPPNVGELDGLRPLSDILFHPGARSDPSRPPRRPSHVLIDVDWIHHPAFMFPIEQLLAVVEHDPEGLSFELESGIWGGVPISGSGRFAHDPERTLVVDVEAHAPIARSAPWKPTRYWARGAFETDGFALGPWSIEASTGEFDVRRETLRLHDVTAVCGPTLRQRGAVEFDLGRPDSVPLRANFRIDSGAIPELSSALLLDPEDATGNVDVTGVLEGWLHPGHHPLSDLVGTIAFVARDGEIRRELPAVLAIANANDSNKLAPSRDVVRYSEIDGVLELKAGRVSLDEFAIDSPDLRVLVSGTVNLVDPSHDMEAVVGVFFFRSLDEALSRIPVLNKLILGRDKNLVSAYFELTGPWQGPNARLVTTRSLAEGPVQFVMGVPGFVKKGIAAIQSVVLPERNTDAESIAPAARGS
jgi:hypothetical protein